MLVPSPRAGAPGNERRVLLVTGAAHDASGMARVIEADGGSVRSVVEVARRLWRIDSTPHGG